MKLYIGSFVVALAATLVHHGWWVPETWSAAMRSSGCAANHVDVLVVVPQTLSTASASALVSNVTTAIRSAQHDLKRTHPTHHLHASLGFLLAPSRDGINAATAASSSDGLGPPAIGNITPLSDGVLTLVSDDTKAPGERSAGSQQHTHQCVATDVTRALAQLYSAVHHYTANTPWPGWLRKSNRSIVIFIAPDSGSATAAVPQSMSSSEAKLADDDGVVDATRQHRFDTSIVLVDGHRGSSLTAGAQSTSSTLAATCAGVAIGDPDCANAYADQSEMNIEMTLQCLLRGDPSVASRDDDSGDQPSSSSSSSSPPPQAALLRRGMDVRVHTIASMLSNGALTRTLVHAVLDTRHDACLDAEPTSPRPSWLPCASPVSTSMSVRRVTVTPGTAFVEETIRIGRPAVLSGTPVANWSFFASHSSIDTVVVAMSKGGLLTMANHSHDDNNTTTSEMPTDRFCDVKVSRDGVFMDQSDDAKLAPFVPKIDLGYEIQNLSATQMISALNGASPVYQHFTPLPDRMKDSFEPSRPVFLSDEDHRLRKQFLWLSSRGGRTHAVSAHSTDWPDRALWGVIA